MHRIEVTPHQMSALWHALNNVPNSADGLSLSRAYDRVVQDGWAPEYLLDDIVYDTGCGVRASSDVLKAILGKPQGFYRRPRARDTVACAVDQRTAAEVAAMLKMLERLGLAVDPVPLVDALLPALRNKEYLTHAELEVWWFHKERHKMDSLFIETDRGSGPGKYHKFKTSTGYRIEASERGGQVEWITSTAPKYRFRSKLMAA